MLFTLTFPSIPWMLNWRANWSLEPHRQNNGSPRWAYTEVLRLPLTVAEVLSLDAQEAEDHYRLEPVDRMDAEMLSERRWAMMLLERAVVRFRDEMAVADKAELFERLKGFVAGDREVRCAQVAARLGLSESATKSAVHRLRQRYWELVREEIAHTVADPAEIDTEISYLIHC